MFAFFAELLHCTKAYGPLSIDRWHSGRFSQSMLLKIETCTVLSKKISKLPSHFLKKKSDSNRKLCRQRRSFDVNKFWSHHAAAERNSTPTPILSRTIPLLRTSQCPSGARSQDESHLLPRPTPPRPHPHLHTSHHRNPHFNPPPSTLRQLKMSPPS